MAAGNDIAVQNPARDRLGAAPACLWGGSNEGRGACAKPVTKDYLESQGSAYSVGGLRGLPLKRGGRGSQRRGPQELSTELVLNEA